MGGRVDGNGIYNLERKVWWGNFYCRRTAAIVFDLFPRYKDIIKEGDELLNKMQKLAAAIDR